MANYRWLRSGPNEHTVVAERALGRPLPKGACVHHLDGNGLNNKRSNLVICPDQKYHRLLHKITKERAWMKERGIKGWFPSNHKES